MLVACSRVADTLLRLIHGRYGNFPLLLQYSPSVLCHIRPSRYQSADVPSLLAHSSNYVHLLNSPTVGAIAQVFFAYRSWKIRPNIFIFIPIGLGILASAAGGYAT